MSESRVIARDEIPKQFLRLPCLLLAGTPHEIELYGARNDRKEENFRKANYYSEYLCYDYKNKEVIIMGGHGNRNMYYQTGLPGWMRFGYSPGWAGRSPTGLGPGANYLMTGQWPTPQAQAYWQAMQAGQAPYPTFGGLGAMPYGSSQPTGAAPGMAPFTPQASPEQELSFLKNQANALKEQLEQISSRIKEIEKLEKQE